MNRRPSNSARTWATGVAAGSPTAKLILILLADKADEAAANFCCTPSIRSLVAESGAGRSTVLRALNDLEIRALISRHPQFGHDGARLSTGYHLNHSAVQHFSTTDAAVGSPAPCPATTMITTSTAAADNRWAALPPLLPIPHAAQLLGISTASAYRWAARGDLPTRRLKNRVFIQTARLRSLLDVVPRAAVAAPTS